MMMKNKVSILILTIATLLFSGCSLSNNNRVGTPVLTNSNTKISKSIYTASENKVLNQISKLKNKKYILEKTNIESIREDLLKRNADFQNKNKNEAMILNNSDSRNSYIPSYQEPIFTKIVIFPYKDSNDIYYEKQAAWKEIKKGHIVLKTNTKPDSKFSSILNK
jgi:hypothetical protein